jgi:hypothetical protein
VKVDQRLNFVIPIYRSVVVKTTDPLTKKDLEREEEQVVGYVHSVPIRRETFERYFMALSKAYAAMYGQGLSIMAAPRVASYLLKQAAQDIGDWDGEDGVEKGLLGEINRLSSYISAGPGGWESLPLETALSRKMMSDDDVEEATNAVAFFIVNSSMQRRTDLKVTLDGAARLWGAQVSSLSCTEFLASLKTSTGAANTGGTVAPPPMPPKAAESQIPH